MQRCLLRNHLGMPYSANTIKSKELLTDGFGDNIVNLFHFCFREFTSASVKIDLGNFASKVCKTSADTLNDSKSEGDFLLSVDVGVLHTKNVLKVISIGNN